MTITATHNRAGGRGDGEVQEAVSCRRFVVGWIAAKLVGWMNRYEGLKGKPDKIVGAGKYVSENNDGGEVCNLLAADDGMVYGHVETIKNESDRNIRIESIGGSGDRVSGVDVIWTATDPNEGGRRVVGVGIGELQPNVARVDCVPVLLIMI
jgi:hypothetical protein